MKTRRIRKHTEHYGRHRFIDWFITVLICAAAVCLLLFVGMTPVKIKTNELNLFKQDDIVFADRVGKYLVDYGRGDALVYKTVSKWNKERHLGRVVAFPGETVTVSGGGIYINSAGLDESAYALPFPEEFMAEFTVPQKCFLILPDDRSGYAVPDENFDFNSLLTEQKNIIGEIRLKIFPFGEIGLFY